MATASTSTRLQDLAEPGGILISGTTYDHVKTKVKAGFTKCIWMR
jgi:class 3 adenylate cyclase